MSNIYKISDKLNFGKFKGYDIGLVFYFEPQYIDWCIRQISDFKILEFEKLVRNGTYLGPIQSYVESLYSIKYTIDTFSSYKELIDKISPLFKFPLSTYNSQFIIEVLKINNSKDVNKESYYSNNQVYDDKDYNSYKKNEYGKYRGSWAQDIEGLSDNFIDDALGGEPDAYWNID